MLYLKLPVEDNVLHAMSSTGRGGLMMVAMYYRTLVDGLGLGGAAAISGEPAQLTWA